MMLTCDADKIQRVFDNLLRNAYFYSFDNSDITITSFENNGRLIIKFINRGYTIPSEKLNQIFEQFYRLDSARSSEHGGAGLGLAISKKIVELHHGTICAKSENEWIEFEVTLPNM
jgi:two-component system sensor histidine kinase VanS